MLFVIEIHVIVVKKYTLFIGENICYVYVCEYNIKKGIYVCEYMLIYVCEFLNPPPP